MFSRLVFATEGAIANSDHLVGAMIITIAVCATAEVARPLRFLNVPFGLWLIAAPWLLSGATTGATLNDFIAGLVVIGLSLPRGRRSKEHYGSWDRYVVLKRLRCLRRKTQAVNERAPRGWLKKKGDAATPGGNRGKVDWF